MLRFWSLSFLSLVLVLAPFAAVRADEKLPSTQDQIDTLRRDLDDVKKRLTGVETLFDRFGALKDEVAAMRQQLADIQTTLKRLEQARDPMRSFSPSDAPKVGTVPLTGNLRVINDSGYDATVVINSTMYEVRAGQIRTLPRQPAGLLVFEVMAAPFGSLQAPQTRNLRPGDPLNITIYPR
jgi:hypothetical protein